jgi:hypothetical protein
MLIADLRPRWNNNNNKNTRGSLQPSLDERMAIVFAGSSPLPLSFPSIPVLPLPSSPSSIPPPLQLTFLFIPVSSLQSPIHGLQSLYFSCYHREPSILICLLKSLMGFLWWEICNMSLTPQWNTQVRPCDLENDAQCIVFILWRSILDVQLNINMKVIGINLPSGSFKFQFVTLQQMSCDCKQPIINIYPFIWKMNRNNYFTLSWSHYCEYL